MSKYKFREHQITRTCDKTYQDYHSYLPFLVRDFSGHCCYCNMSEKTLDVASFQIDHFIPENAFKGKRDELRNKYDNLMLSCPKCNRAKSDQYTGDLTSPAIENDYFYNPDVVDYNTIFYRNELGGIWSDDEKGKAMIEKLRLYRPLHNYAWVLEKLDTIIARLEQEIQMSDGKKKKDLEAVQQRLMAEYYKKRAHFVAAYRQK